MYYVIYNPRTESYYVTMEDYGYDVRFCGTEEECHNWILNH